MPELPEVETIACTLRQGVNGLPGLPGLTISHADVLWEKTLATPTVQLFQQGISHLTIQTVSRRGKFLVIGVSPFCLLVHLRMTGDLRLELETAPLLKHDRIILHFTNNSRLVFNDTRKFGRMWFIAAPEEILGQLGPEPLDEKLDGDTFYTMIHSKKTQLKPLLLDQTFLAGLGNIYTDESLFAARLHPYTRANTITLVQANQLLAAIRTVLQDGIEKNGASIDWVYRGGDFQNHFKVYQRNGKPCLNCGTPISRVIIGQRGTHFCPVCQPDPLIREGRHV
jgi:formamidopyrimidine-DNA glycosylase